MKKTAITVFLAGLLAVPAAQALPCVDEAGLFPRDAQRNGWERKNITGKVARVRMRPSGNWTGGRTAARYIEDGVDQCGGSSFQYHERVRGSVFLWLDSDGTSGLSSREEDEVLGLKLGGNTDCAANRQAIWDEIQRARLADQNITLHIIRPKEYTVTEAYCDYSGEKGQLTVKHEPGYIVGVEIND